MKGTRITVAGVILTKNEESNVGRCLRSIVWCDELLVLDSGSTDKTNEQALEHGARFTLHVQPEPFDIAKQRNWALDKVGLNSDWVLFLDADEEITPELRREIQNKLSRDDPSINAYELTPKYLFWGKWLRRTQGFPNWHARLVKRGKAGFSGGVWEHFDSRAKIGRIFEPYNHYANSKGLSDWLARHDRYSTWDAQKIVSYLTTRNPDALGTNRKARLRLLAAKFYPLRPYVRFIHVYILRLGFLEGKPAFTLSILYFFYESMTVIKVRETLRRLQGLSL